MIALQKLATVVTGVTSVVGLQLISAIITPINISSNQLSIGWGFISPALARNIKYVPPVNDNPKTTQGAGSRGCSQAVPVSLTLLTPNHRVGLTSSGKPTFLWYVPDSQPVQMEFSLVEPGVPKPLFQKQLQMQKEGIVEQAIPQDSPELVAGKEYRWTVTLICNPKRRSEDVFAQGWIKRIPTTPNLTQKLATAKSDSDRANIYAEAGLWYDALTTVWAAATANPNEPGVQEARFSLLEQVGLTQIAQRERQRLAKQ